MPDPTGVKELLNNEPKHTEIGIFATGLKHIKDMCDAAGCKVDFKMEKDDFIVIFYRNLRENWNSSNNTNDNTHGSVSQKLPRDYQDNRREDQRFNERESFNFGRFNCKGAWFNNKRRSISC